MTSQRRAVLEELRRFRSHPTAEEVHQVVRRRLPRIGLATVYRNLEVLRRSGHIIRFPSGRGGFRYDGRPGPHLHVRCESCGSIEDVPLRELPDLRGLLRGKSGFVVEDYDLMFRGTCPDCRPRNPSIGTERKKKETTCS